MSYAAVRSRQADEQKTVFFPNLIAADSGTHVPHRVQLTNGPPRFTFSGGLAEPGRFPFRTELIARQTSSIPLSWRRYFKAVSPISINMTASIINDSFIGSQVTWSTLRLIRRSSHCSDNRLSVVEDSLRPPGLHRAATWFQP